MTRVRQARDLAAQTDEMFDGTLAPQHMHVLLYPVDDEASTQATPSASSSSCHAEAVAIPLTNCVPAARG
jgi:hypothetical protein